MSAPIPDHPADAIGPGRLILVVGPSGAGKDTLIALARAACADNAGILFPQRIVTRDASSFEDNGAIAPARFAEAVAGGAFALHWQAHGLGYGLPVSVTDAIRDGHTVVVNVSRTVVAAARAAYARVTVVAVTAPLPVLAARLAARARPSDGSLEARLTRSIAGVDPDVTIVNVGNADDHAGMLTRVIKGE